LDGIIRCSFQRLNPNPSYALTRNEIDLDLVNVGRNPNEESDAAGYKP
jgi:hypothetical protein